MAKKQPTIVAELGRPETQAETASRKAENSRLYRQRKTVNNLVFSLLVTVGLVFVIYLMVPRGVGDYEDRSVDVAKLAESAGADRPLAVPAVPDTWKAKQATLTSDEDVSYWQIHYTTENESYATVVQAFRLNGEPVPDEWIATKLEGQDATGAEVLGGIDWTVYEHPERRADQVNMRFGLEGEFADDTLLVYGTDDGGTIRVLATQVADSLNASDAQPAEGTQ
ncbi:MAG: DUF4245 family protein [Leucobacter sp.]